MESTKAKTNKLPKWALLIIILLGLLLLMQTAAIGYFVFANQQTHVSAQNQPVHTRSNVNAATPAGLMTHYSPPVRTRYSAYSSNPFAELERMESAVNRLFSNFMTASPFSYSDFGAAAMQDFTPNIDLEEKENQYIVSVDLPGIDKDKVNIRVKGQQLVIQGMRETSHVTEDDTHGYFAQERSYGSFARTIALPGPVDEANVRAEYNNGVLVITLPHAEKNQEAQQIAVN